MLTRTLAFAFIVVSTSLANAAPPGPTLPEEDAQGGATRAQAIEAYAKDCHANLEALGSNSHGEEAMVAECQALVIEQNCNPDTFGCEAARISCQEDCQPGCTRCQGTCANTCDTCKGACGGDKACLRKCAEARTDCRGGCMTSLNQCQERDCNLVDSTCFTNAKKRLRSCDAGACEDYIACYDAQEDYEKAQKNCASKARGMDAWCLGVCESEHGFPSWYLESDDSQDASEDGAAFAKACTAEAQCPPDYAAVVPYLGSFCAGTTSDASFAALTAEVQRKSISKRTLSIVFNAYGAIHGYEFKKEKWLNGLFYGAGGAWLPPSCRTRMKTVASAKAMPFVLTKLRDRAKKIWNEAR